MTNGFGYVLMTSPLAPVDFGIKSVRTKDKNARSMKGVIKLIETHHPEAIVLEDPTAPGSQQKPRIRRLARAIANYADNEVIDLSILSRAAVTECFAPVAAKTRYEIAVAIAQRIPAFERFLPPTRKKWDSEHQNMSIFAAAALAITYFDIWSL
jgi:hypothetical protein